MTEMDVFRYKDNRTTPPTVKEYELVDRATREELSNVKADLKPLAYATSVFYWTSGQAHSSTKDQIEIDITSGDKFYVTVTATQDLPYAIFGYKGSAGVSLLDTRANRTVEITSTGDYDSIGIYIGTNSTFQSQTVSVLVEKENSVIRGLDVNTKNITKLSIFNPEYIRNGSFGNASNANVITAGRFDINDNATTVSFETNRPLDSGADYYSIGIVFFSVGIGDLSYTPSNVLSYTDYDRLGTQRLGKEIAIPKGAKTAVITIAQFDSDNDVWIALRKDSFDGYTLKAVHHYNFNSDSEHILNNARHIPGNSATPLTLLHFSDLHGDASAMDRIIAGSKYYASQIDDMICTGDMVPNTYQSITSWWNKNVLTCIGNHDSASYSSETGYNWTALSMADRDNYYIAPFESDWNIVHTAGLSYYYKDYTASNIRLIVMDSMLYTDNGTEAATQTTWLENLLADAITNNLHVLIAIHAPHGGATAKKCSFTDLRKTIMPTWSNCNTPQTVIDTVAAKITAGLKFIGYIVGHTHWDAIYDAENDGTQLMYCITCAAVSQTAQWINSDMSRSNTADAYNLVTIDTTNTLVKIIRGGGADIDTFMRPRKAISFNYSTGEIVGEVL